MQNETGRWKDRWKMRDLLLDERCSREVLDYITTTDEGGGGGGCLLWMLR